METNAFLFATLAMNKSECVVMDIFSRIHDYREAYQSVKVPNFWKDAILNLSERLLGEEESR